MRGPLIDAVVIAIVVAVVLLATAHLWGPLLGMMVRRVGGSGSVWVCGSCR